MFTFSTLEDLDPVNKRVLVRSDLNVPLDGSAITDDFRIKSAVPTLDRLAGAGAKVIVMSHLGRPKGKDKKLSLEPVAKRLGELAKADVEFVPTLIGKKATVAVKNAKPGTILVLENTRFEAGETKNDPGLAEKLSALGDAFVLDAFGTAHRAHASTVGIGAHLPTYAGPLLASELESMGALLENPARPFIVVLGGAKVSDKIGVVKSLLPVVDSMLIGGGMCFTLMAASGLNVANSMLEEDMIGEMRVLLNSADGAKIVLPEDLVVAAEFAEDAEPSVVDVTEVPAGTMGLDIGPQTAARFASIIESAGSVFWNGPMGVFEWESFRGGTATVAKAVGDTDGFSVVGGGDSVAALRLLGLEGKVSFVSTGGGAGLELLEGKKLPGVEMLERWA